MASKEIFQSLPSALIVHNELHEKCRLTELSKEQFHVAFSLFLFLTFALAKRNKRTQIVVRIIMSYLEDVRNLKIRMATTPKH